MVFLSNLNYGSTDITVGAWATLDVFRLLNFVVNRKVYHAG